MVRSALIPALFMVSAAVGATDYFVDADNGSDSNSGTGCVNFLSYSPSVPNVCATAFKSIHNNLLNSPGATEYIRASNATYDFMYLHDLGGTSSQWIQFIGTLGPRGAHPLVQQASSGQVGALQIAYNAHYVIIDSIDFTNPTNLNPNGSAALIGSTTNPCTNDHITIRNSTFFGSGGGGISAEYMDYLQLLNNIVHDNGSTITTASPSGISVLAFCNYDTAAGYHVVIQNNVVYNEFSTTGSTNPSDYNCIISDDQRHYQTLSYTNAGVPPYTGPILVQGNFVYNCQGKGLHDWASANLIWFDHNISLLNCFLSNTPCSVNDGDVDVLGATGHLSSNAVITNNIIIAPNYAINVKGIDPAGSVIACGNYEFGAGGAKPANWDSSGSFSNQNYVTADPKLINPVVGAGLDPRPSSLTPALPGVC